MTDRVCVGAVVGAHGIRGWVRVKSFTSQPADIAAYGPVEDEAGRRRFELALKGETRGLLIVRLDGVADRNAAEALAGTRLYVPRERLPATGEDEFLYADLVGLRAETPEGRVLGTVRGVFDFGAGDVLDIGVAPENRAGIASGGSDSVMLPFTRRTVPVVDVSGGRLVVDPPAWIAGERMDGTGQDAGDEESDGGSDRDGG